MASAATEAARTSSHDMRQQRSNLALFFVWFAVILALKWPVLNQPPVWDTSMSVFPAAITLSENSFDLEYLLDQPGYAEGGPNVHSISLVTWLTAALIALLGDTSALFPILHLIHFAIAAATMAALFRFAQPLLGSALGAGASVAILLFPLVLTQAGYMYLEFPMLAVTTFALLAWARGRLSQSVLWSIAAVLIKSSGIIIPVAIAGMAFFDPRPAHRNRRAGLLVLVIPASLLAAVISMTPSIGGRASIRGHLLLMLAYLIRIPDLLVLLVAYLTTTLILSPWDPKPRGRDSTPPISSEHQTRLLTVAFLVAAFLAFYLLLPLVGFSVAVLPRYYVQVFPFAVFGLLAALRGVLGNRVLVGLLILMILWAVINRNGDWYPDNSINNFSLIERSGEYTALLDLQEAGIRALEDLPDQVPAFYDQPAHYKLTYPLMGYSDGPLDDGHSIRHEEPYKHGQLEDFPDDFYMLYEYPWLGGEIIRSVWDQAEADPNRNVTAEQLCSSAFCSDIIHVMPGTIP